MLSGLALSGIIGTESACVVGSRVGSGASTRVKPHLLGRQLLSLGLAILVRRHRGAGLLMYGLTGTSAARPRCR